MRFSAICCVVFFLTSSQAHGFSFGGYVSDEEDRFLDNVWSFVDYMDGHYTRKNYRWARHRHFTTSSQSYVDVEDISYFSGHGNHHHIWPSSSESSLDLSDGSSTWGSSSIYGTGDSEYVVFQSCSVLSLSDYDSHNWSYFWKSTASRDRPFSGLHMVMGYKSDSGSDDDVGEDFGRYLKRGWEVRESWLEAIMDNGRMGYLVDEDGNREWTYLPGYACVIYIKPNKDETVSTRT
ncbi:MAG: DUF6345 domain-containing protein, partial [Thermodesulfobacteriota bacterium]|nr:DUF6345 domain-containing protein [Thermodesulfobacteriota bacterium]